MPLLPLYAAGLKPIAVYNVAMLLGFVFSGYGAFVLGRLLTGSAGAGIIAGIFYAFLPGDYVFALTRVVPDPGPLRAPDVPDKAGRSPRDNARIFLEENGRTYNASTFGWLDTPGFDYEITGELDVSGWAFSPHGIRDVRLSFGNGAVSMSAERFEWASLRRHYPWYPETERAGFRLTIPVRPESVVLVTDLLVEIIDGQGDVTPLDHVFIKWHPRKPVRKEGLDFGKLVSLGASLELDAASVTAIRGGDPAPLVAALVARSEGRSNDEFLDAVFPVLLDRPTDPEARHYYRTRLERGGKRRDVVEAMLNSTEFRRTLERRTISSP